MVLFSEVPFAREGVILMLLNEVLQERQPRCVTHSVEMEFLEKRGIFVVHRSFCLLRFFPPFVSPVRRF